MKNFRTYELAKTLYLDCKDLKLRKPLKDQFERALLSVVLNIVEGSAKPTAKDKKRFYAMSLGSLREVQFILEVTNHQNLYSKSDTLAACLYKLIQNPGGSS